MELAQVVGLMKGNDGSICAYSDENTLPNIKMYLSEVAETIDKCIDSDEHVSGGQVTLDVNIFDLKIYIYLH